MNNICHGIYLFLPSILLESTVRIIFVDLRIVKNIIKKFGELSTSQPCLWIYLSTYAYSAWIAHLAIVVSKLIVVYIGWQAISIVHVNYIS
jgi:hypothetical protein